MSLLRLPSSVYRDLRAHGEETYPRECCGALLGRAIAEGWQVDRHVRAANSQAGSTHNRYAIAPDELVKIAREARRLGLEIAGFYHSHPDHPAHWSATDLTEAHWIGCSYVITEVAQGKAASTSAFLLAGLTEEEKRFEPQTIQIAERPGAG
jgi:proteasome lid subunit RPN8/RPN11